MLEPNPNNPLEMVDEELDEELDDEFDLSEFGVDVEDEDETIVFSEDDAKYACGFPDWDLLPPKK